MKFQFVFFLQKDPHLLSVFSLSILCGNQPISVWCDPTETEDSGDSEDRGKVTSIRQNRINTVKTYLLLKKAIGQPDVAGYSFQLSLSSEEAAEKNNQKRERERERGIRV